MNATLQLPVDNRAPRLARTLIAADLANVLPEECFDTLCLLITEVVTNSLRHAEFGAGDRIELHIRLVGGYVRATVRDPGGAATPQLKEPHLMSSGGRGLLLVDELADRWGIKVDDGTCVWFELCTN